MVEHRIARLWADRARLVWRYLRTPSAWPDGIDTPHERWYLDREDYWRERAARLEDGRWPGGIGDEAAHALWADEKGGGAGRPRVVEGEPWVEAGVSRRTWYRRRKEDPEELPDPARK